MTFSDVGTFEMLLQARMTTIKAAHKAKAMVVALPLLLV
jgi:hypothetical protein